MIPLASNRNRKRQSKLGKAEIPVAPPVAPTGRKKTRKPVPQAGDATSPIGNRGADDHLEGIVSALRRLPEAEQAEVIRRLGNAQPDPGLTVIGAAWNSLPEAIRAGIVAMVKAAGAAAT
ncbi:MAG TPA: hypothetical protein VMV69_24830 [Pirellulales bacterium]|nr:hypothetical protein [Pirellulales bacterium]